MSTVKTREHTDAIVAALVSGGLSVGDAVAPDPAPDGGYAVVYQLLGGQVAPRLGAPADDAFLAYQVTCVGKSREQAEWVADKAIEILVGGISVAGRRTHVTVDFHGGVLRDDQQTPPIFYSTPRFRVATA